MTARTLCLVFNNVDEHSGIGKLCAWSVRTALEAGWRVTVIARDLDPELRPHVEWLPLYVPPRLHAVQWYAAAPTVRRAMAGRSWDVVHVQQPQLVGFADVLHLHYLVRAARDRAADAGPTSMREKVGLLQTRLTEIGENRRLARLPEHLTLLPVSRFLLEEFTRLYGAPARAVVLDSPGPAQVSAISEQEQAMARTALVGDRQGRVLGYLGGGDERKGGRALLDALAHLDDTVVLWGGSGRLDHPTSDDTARVVHIGHVTDLREFFAACDGFAAVSSFDPGPLTALEASAHGVPVVGTAGCGFVQDLVRNDGALLWVNGEALEPVLAELTARGEDLVAAAQRHLATRTQARQALSLLEVYEGVVEGRPRSA